MVPHVQANSCSIESGPAPSLVQYKQTVEAELAALAGEASGSCSGRMSQNASSVVGAAWTQIALFPHRMIDFRYEFSVTAQGDGRKAVIRDAKLFDAMDKKIASTAESLARGCKLDSATRQKIAILVQENQALASVFKQTAIGQPPAIMSGLRESRREIWEGITQDYTPGATQSCKNVHEKLNEKTEKTLQSAIDIGGKTEKALESWRKAIAIFRGEAGTTGNRPTDYVAMQRRLLSNELSRQGLSRNSKQVILSNFDCFKANTSDKSQISELVEARLKCLSNPILGVDRIFAGWRNKIHTAPTSDHRVIAHKNMNIRMARTIDVPAMYHVLRPMAAHEIDINAGTLKSLIDTHIDLTTTNEMIEKRITPMQNNCMKGSPDIVGGCR